MARGERREGKPRPTQEDVRLYMKAVKDTFPDEREKYDGFLQAIKSLKYSSDYQAELPGVVERVKDLFEGHRDLILGFNKFLPEGYEITLPVEDEEPSQENLDECEEAVNFMCKIQTRCQDNDHVYKSFLRIMVGAENKTHEEIYNEFKALFHDHQDLVEEFTRFFPDTSRAVFIDSPPRNSIVRDKNTATPIHQLQVGKKGMAVASHGECDLSVDRPESNRDRLGEIEKKRREYRKRRERASDDRYFEHDFNKSIRRIEDAASDPIHQRRDESLRNESNQPKPVKFVDTDREREDVATTKPIERDRENRERGKEKVVEDVASPRVSKVPKMNKYYKCIRELNLSKSERPTPSYRLLPKDYPIQNARERTALCYEVLNDNWVSVRSGSAGYNFREVQKNQYEEIMFRCEDDRFELDMLIESMKLAADHVEELLEKINNGTIKTDIPIRIEALLTAKNLRCIERLYGDYGLEVLDALRKNVPAGLPVILTRLKQKHKELVTGRSAFNEVWAEIYSENHQKSLDHPRG